MKRILLTTMLLTSINLMAQNYEMWGVTQISGDNNLGTIYKLDSSGSIHTVVHSFADGEKPAGSLVQASNGRLYGVTSFGGDNDLGVIFSIGPVAGDYVRHWNLSSTTGGRPRGGFMEASNGLLYVTTYESGDFGNGTILELDPSNHNLVVRHHFGATSTEPAQPMAGELVEAATGKLYGVTRFGGLNDDGTIYEYDLSSHSISVLHDFSSASNGAHPFNSLTHVSNGLLYGMTYEGGPTNGGVLFAYDAAVDTFQVQEYFSNAGTVGTKPQGALIEAADGQLYGMTSSNGYLFSFDTQTKDVTGIQSVGDARGTLLEASNGNLYGVTYIGSVFEYDMPSSTYSSVGGVGVYALYGHLIEVSTSTSTGIATPNKTLTTMNIHPNPAVDQITIDGNIISVKIYDINGSLVQSETTNRFSISNLEAGMYVAVVLTNDGVKRTQFVKK